MDLIKTDALRQTQSTFKFDTPDCILKDDFDGIELTKYAARKGTTPEKIWGQIKSGQLLARCFQGKLLILDGSTTTSEQFDNIHSTPPRQNPDVSAPLLNEVMKSHHQQENLNSYSHKSSDISLLLDHLSLAKEENKEILRMTQEAINKITDLTTSILNTKEEMLCLKDRQIEDLKTQLNTREKTIKHLGREVDNLKTLNNVLST